MTTFLLLTLAVATFGLAVWCLALLAALRDEVQDMRRDVHEVYCLLRDMAMEAQL